MPTPSHKAIKNLDNILNKENLEELIKKLAPLSPENKELPPAIPGSRNWSKDAQLKRLALIKEQTSLELPYLTGNSFFDSPELLKGNIENFIGFSQIPTGLIGPLRINGSSAKGDFYVPMATSEGALIASYNRGAVVTSKSGGVTSICLIESLQRTPSFKFKTFSDAGQFLIWAIEHLEVFKHIVSNKTAHGSLEDIKPHIDGNQVTLICDYTTGDASGQNMVTICTRAICEYIIENYPVKPVHWLVEGNLSGDKKASAISFISTRGKKVTAETVIKKDIVTSILHTTVQKMLESWQIAIINGIQSGSIGVNFHFANCLCAIFLACGQDVATVAEAAVGTTRCEITEEGDLYICVSLPNLIVGTVGGGTSLPTHKECLEIIGCHGNGNARKFAEICGATALCGEISIIASMAAHDFARAHAIYGRKKK